MTRSNSPAKGQRGGKSRWHTNILAAHGSLLMATVDEGRPFWPFWIGLESRVLRRWPLTGLVAATFLLLFASGASAAATHIVHSGDTLWTIAARYHVSVGVLVTTNRLRHPDRLSLNQHLIIPQRGELNRGQVVPAVRGHAPATPFPARGESWASGVVAQAQRFVGVRYQWGGATPEGFDCSGFVTYVLGRMGIKVPRTTFAMYDVGKRIPKAGLQVGDVVFFQTVSPGPSHAGLYIGSNAFIHSSSASGHVTVTSMDDPYYSPRYLGARRY